MTLPPAARIGLALVSVLALARTAGAQLVGNQSTSATSAAGIERTRSVRVLPLGDSITQGGQGYASYRYALWEALAVSSDVDFVGTRTNVFGGDGGSNPNTSWYPDYYTSFDRDHAGYWGWRTDQVLDVILDGAFATEPDVTLIHLGTNDIGQSGASAIASAATNLGHIIDAIRCVRPVSRFALAQVIPIGVSSGYGANAGQVLPLNTEIADVAAEQHEAWSPVVLVDQFTGFDLGTDMQSDALHPNLAGEAKMAAVWEGVLPSLLGPATPALQPTVMLANASFESLGLSDGTVVGTPAGIDWRFAATASTFRGVFNPAADTYVGAGGSGTPQGADGDEVAYLYNNGGAFERVYLYQTLATTLMPDVTYTLTVAVGNRLPTNPYGPSTWGGYRVELMAGNEVIASERDQLTPVAGTFEDVSISVWSRTVPPRLLGQVLTVRLSITGENALDSTDFDDVRLSVQ